MISSNQEVRYESKTLEHLGLVAGMYDELGIGKTIDKHIKQDDNQRNYSVGTAVKALVLNGLGFVNRSMYLVKEFFAGKPVEELLGEDIKAGQLHDVALGRALDRLYESEIGLTELYKAISKESVSRLGLEEELKYVHMDTTSFHVDGKYNSESYDKEKEEGVVHITKGYSRDHRGDLNQVGLNLIVSHQAGIPLLMEALGGNKEDKGVYKEAIESHIQGLVTPQESIVVIDSAGYTKTNIEMLSSNGTYFISRVPSTIKLVHEIKSNLEMGQFMAFETATDESDNVSGYSYVPLGVKYAGVPQRWLVVHSQAAQQRNLKTVQAQLNTLFDKDLKQLQALSQQHFSCQQDAFDALERLTSSLAVSELHHTHLVQHKHFNKPGRPPEHAHPDWLSYTISASLALPTHLFSQRLFSASCFILATQCLDDSILSDLDVLINYKLAPAERGFRFLKDPHFSASTLYLKSPQRVMALLMVMTICLLVYAALEFRIRTTLRQQQLHLPDQKGKPTQTPTAKWVFQLFQDVHLLRVFDHTQKLIHCVVLNLKPVLLPFLHALGSPYLACYNPSSSFT